MMKGRVVYLLYFILLFDFQNVVCIDYETYEYFNKTEPALLQLYDFRKEHPKPIGILTTGSGKLVEIRETIALNSDPFSHLYSVDIMTQSAAERIPERVVHALGTGAFGYFEVTHDVSKYTKADVFNGIGKKTPVMARLSSALQSRGSSDTARDLKGFAMKFYTNEGILDLMCISFAAYFYRDPNDFMYIVHAFKKNPKNDVLDFTSYFDYVTKRPDNLHAFMWFLSDYGIPNGYRKMDVFAIHAFEVHNKQGDKYFVKFNFRSEQGVEFLSNEEAARIQGRDLDYFKKDLYNAIEEKRYPCWRLEMDVMHYSDVKKLDYNPFQVNLIWKKGTYFTVPVGRLVLNRNPDNFFALAEQVAFNPARLVPGIPGPVDNLFRTRRQIYRDTQIHRLGTNHNRIIVNTPLYAKNYLRDGKPPVRDNGRDAPNYYPNSFSGPVPYVDASIPKERLTILETNAVDLQPAAQFYNEILDCEQRERLVNNTATVLVTVAPFLRRRTIRLYTLTDPELGQRLAEAVEVLSRAPKPRRPRPLRPLRNWRDDPPLHPYHEHDHEHHKSHRKPRKEQSDKATE